MRLMPSIPVGATAMPSRRVGSLPIYGGPALRANLPRSSTLPYVRQLGDAAPETTIPLVSGDQTQPAPSSVGIPILSTISPVVPSITQTPGVNINVTPSGQSTDDGKILGMQPGVAAAVGIGAAVLLYFVFAKK